jgi:hypothetical protein
MASLPAPGILASLLTSHSFPPSKAVSPVAPSPKNLGVLEGSYRGIEMAREKPPSLELIFL